MSIFPKVPLVIEIKMGSTQADLLQESVGWVNDIHLKLLPPDSTDSPKAVTERITDFLSLLTAVPLNNTAGYEPEANLVKEQLVSLHDKLETMLENGEDIDLGTLTGSLLTGYIKVYTRDCKYPDA